MRGTTLSTQLLLKRVIVLSYTHRLADGLMTGA